MLEDRLVALRNEGRTEEAVELAKAALLNDTVVDVTVDGGEVRVRTERFEGVHELHRTQTGEPYVDTHGRYTARDDRFDVTVKTATMNDDALARAEEELGIGTEPEPPVEEDATAGAPLAAEVETPDAGPSPRRSWFSRAVGGLLAGIGL